MRPAFKWNPELSDTAGQTPGTRRNGTDLTDAAEKAIAALEKSAPIEQPDEPPAPPSCPAIPPPPVEASEPQLEGEALAEATRDSLVTDEEASSVDQLLRLSEPPVAIEAASVDDGSIRPFEIDNDDDDPPVVPLVASSPQRAWLVRGLTATAVLLIGAVAFGAAFSERSPEILGKSVKTPRVVVLGGKPAPSVVEEPSAAPDAEATENAPPDEVAAPAKKKIKGGAFGFWAPETKGKKGVGRTSIERMPFGSVPSREDEPMGVYPFLIRDKAPEDQPALPPPPEPPSAK